MSRYVFEPYADESRDPLRDLRTLCRELFPLPYKGEPMRLITAVGAPYDPEKGLTGVDHDWMAGIIKTCFAHQSAPIADDFVLTAMDRDKVLGRDDFLAHDRPKTELLAILNIIHHKGENGAFCGILAGDMSERTIIPEMWTLAAYESGALAVATAGMSICEATSEQFLFPLDNKQVFREPKVKHEIHGDSRYDRFDIVFRRKNVDAGWHL